MNAEIDIDELCGILEKECQKVAGRITGNPHVSLEGVDGEDRERARASWRHQLSRHGVTWKYDSNGWGHDAPEGHVAVADFLVDKGATTLFIPNDMANKTLELGCLPEPQKKPRTYSEKLDADGNPVITGEPIMRAARNTTQYVNLQQVEPSDDGRRIVFQFDNGTNFAWSVVEFKFFHGDTGLEFGESHFGNVVWGTNERGDLIRPGHPTFFSTIQTRAKQGWVNNFFRILSLYIAKRVEDRRRDGAYRLAEKRLNKLDTMLDKDLIWPIESLAKNNFVAQMNLDNLCKQVFRGDRVLSFKEMQESGLDKWFFSHVGEGAAPRYLRNDQNQYNMNEDVYAGDEQRQYILGNYMDSYRTAVKADMGDVFRYVWEKYKFPLASQTYWFTNFKQSYDFLVGLGYDSKRLMDYMFDGLDHQGLAQHISRNMEDITLIRDYARMANDVVGRDFDRYPRHLKTAHDIVMRNYRVNQSKVLAKKYEQVCEGLKKMEYKGEVYSIVAPSALDLVVKEGQSLNHCVANYIEGLVQGQYAILFLRTNEEIDRPLVTVQVQDGRVVQSRGVNNRPATREEQEFIDKYADQLAKQKELKLEAA